MCKFISGLLEEVAIPLSKGSSWSRDQTQISCVARRFFTVWATKEDLYQDIDKFSNLWMDEFGNLFTDILVTRNSMLSSYINSRIVYVT